jgi:predicted negative regulator of RcsB-dependent stress response
MALDLEEQEQLDEAKEWWRKNGNKVIWGVTAFLLIAAGWRGWQTWTEKQTAEASGLYERAVQAMSNNDVKAAKEATARLMEDYPRSAYAAPAAWLIGRLNYENGDIKSARAQYEYALEHARDDGAKQLARLRLAQIKLDQKDHAGALVLVSADFAPAFQGLAGQLKGDILADQGKTADARAAYQQAIKSLDDKSPLKSLLEIRLDAMGG